MICQIYTLENRDGIQFEGKLIFGEKFVSIVFEKDKQTYMVHFPLNQIIKVVEIQENIIK